MQKLGKYLKIAAGLVAGLGLLFATGSLRAQTNAPGAKFPPNRFLFIIDTSKAMEHRAQGTLKAMQELLLSELNGQMRSGDSMAIWTFNDDLHAGKFPLQLWTTQTRRNVLLGAANFLKDQKYEKQGSLEKVIPQIEWVIKNSEFITVILISDGSEKIAGTPYDERINEYYSVWQREQQAAHMPFLTLLRAKKGRITDYAVSAYPWPLDVPALPQELLTAKEPPKPAQPRKSPPIGQPLIVVGKKPQPSTVESQASQPTNEVSHTNIAPTATESTAITSPLKGAEPASLAEGKLDGSSPQLITSANQGTASANEATHTTTVPQANPQPSAPAPAVVSRAPTEPPPGSAEKTPSQPISTAADSQQPTSGGSASPASAAEGQVALPSNSLFSQRTVLVIGAAVLLIGAMAALFLRRSRPAAPSASLITRSLERENGPAPSESEGSER